MLRVLIHSFSILADICLCIHSLNASFCSLKMALCKEEIRDALAVLKLENNGRIDDLVIWNDEINSFIKHCKLFTCGSLINNKPFQILIEMVAAVEPIMHWKWHLSVEHFFTINHALLPTVRS